MWYGRNLPVFQHCIFFCNVDHENHLFLRETVVFVPDYTNYNPVESRAGAVKSDSGDNKWTLLTLQLYSAAPFWKTLIQFHVFTLMLRMTVWVVVRKKAVLLE
jgi:hypothetical protein